jgi:isoamylase
MPRAMERSEAAPEAGAPEPLGATRSPRGVNLAVRCSAERLALVVFGAAGAVRGEWPLDPARHRSGAVWHAFMPGAGAGLEYGWRVNASSDVTTDPRARAIAGAESFGRSRGGHRGAEPRVRRSVVADETFDWQGTAPPRTPLRDTVIYELHVRGFTRHASSGAAQPGTFAALIERLPALRDLGVTAIELLPVTDFDETAIDLVAPDTGEPLVNFWGYQPLQFSALRSAWAADSSALGARAEFQQLVRECHRLGLEVILDLVFNHTGESERAGLPPAWSSLEPEVAHIRDAAGRLIDVTGCGNTVNANHPAMIELIVDALRHWAEHFHIDGFRLDLAAALTRGEDGEPLAHPPLFAAIAADPLLVNCKWIAEPWDAVGLQLLGRFPGPLSCTQWNDRFRDDVRRFVRGDAGLASALANRLAGSSDIFAGTGDGPERSVNFITCHDGFTLRDVVSFAQRHNESNGENGRDGHAGEISWNGSTEGESGDAALLARRRREQRDLLALLLLSQGVPMLLAGDERGRTQRGNNNPYTHDDEWSWIDWSDDAGDPHLPQFVRALLAFRRSHVALRRDAFFESGEDSQVRWHGRAPNAPDWSQASRELVMELDDPRDAPLLLIACSQEGSREFELPRARRGAGWLRWLDTRASPPHDALAENALEPLVDPTRWVMGGAGVVVLISPLA